MITSHMDGRTHIQTESQMHATTIPRGGQNWPQVKSQTVKMIRRWLLFTSRQETTYSAAAKRRHMRPMKQAGNPDIPKYWSDWRYKIFSWQHLCTIDPDNAAMLEWPWKLKSFNICGTTKFVRTTQHIKWVVRWMTPDFSLAAALYIHSRISNGYVKWASTCNLWHCMKLGSGWGSRWGRVC